MSKKKTRAPRKLHIGGTEKKKGWEILNVLDGPGVEHVGDARDLSRFENDTFSAIYASHILEHLGYKDGIPAALREWHRVLRPGGTLYVSVPDLDVLARMFLQPGQTLKQRFEVMRMMFGGQLDEFDFHYSGLNEEFLRGYFHDVGFINPYRVRDFGLFDDSSTWTVAGLPISCNMIAEKPE